MTVMVWFWYYITIRWGSVKLDDTCKDPRWWSDNYNVLYAWEETLESCAHVL